MTLKKFHLVFPKNLPLQDILFQFISVHNTVPYYLRTILINTPFKPDLSKGRLYVVFPDEILYTL
jgi:hypothetical protein